MRTPSMVVAIAVALGAGLAAAPGTLRPTTAAAATYPPVSVYLGYADNLRPSGFFPNPWSGSPSTNFVGTGPTYDSGAIRIDNPTGSAITVDNVHVDIGSTGFDPWGLSTLTIPANGHLILAQTSSAYNFDTSDVGTNGTCSNDGLIPLVRVTIYGITEAYTDTRQVLNTGGFDLAACPSGSNESHQWQLVGGGPAPPETIGGGSPSVPHQSNCWIPGGPGTTVFPVNCTTGEFYHRFQDLAIPGRGEPLDFTRTYSAFRASQTGPLGFGWTDTYNMVLTVDPASSDVTINEEPGSQVVFTPTPSGFQAPSRVIATLVQNADGSYTFTRGTGEQFLFTSGGRLTQESDRNGYKSSLAYNGSGQLASVTDPPGRALSFSYGTNGLLASVKDVANRQVSFTYDANGNLASATDVNGGVTTFTYDANHLMLTMTDPNGGTVTNVYDSSGRVTSQTDPMSRTTSFSYTSTGTTITDPNGNITVEQFQNNELVSVTEGSGTSQSATWSYAYDPNTLGITSITDPNSHTWTHTYDANGNLLTTVDPLNRKTSYTYDALNDLTSMTDPLGVTTTWTYDANGNMLTGSRPLTATGQTRQTTYTYGDSMHPGDVTALTDPDGKVWSFAYDANGDLASRTDPLGDKTTIAYEAIGRPISSVSPRGNVSGGNPSAFTTSYTYDAFGDVLTETDPLGHATVSTFDRDRNLTSVTDPIGNRTTYQYDRDNELTKVTRPDGSTLASSYDADGDLTTQTNGLSKSTTYTYDALKRPTSITDSLGQKTSFAYDGVGNLVSLTDPSGQVTSDGYDAANERTTITYSDGKTPSVSYTYDADGRRMSMSDGTGTSSYSYDSLNRVTKSTNGAGQSVTYGYELAGRITSLTYPNAQVVTRTYDAAGRLASLADGIGHTTSFSYDPDGNVVTQGYPNATQATYTYDAAEQTVSITDRRGGAAFASFSYTRNPNSQLSGDSPTGMSQPAQSYGYDQVNRLSGVNGSSYGYDSAGQITQLASGASLSYDAAGQLTGMTRGGVLTSFSYDSRGNRLTGLSPEGTAATYAYDQANHLTGFQTTPPPASSLISGGGYHSLAARSDGTVWAWGFNAFGQLGNGTTTNSSSPIEVTGLAGISRVAAGNMHSLALRADGTVWAWGFGGDGQLGNGSTASSSVPVQVSGLAGATAIASGANHSLAVKSDGTVAAWGDNAAGELGNGTTTNSSTAVTVSNLTGVIAVAGGGMPNPPDHSLALKSDGTVWAWGYNKQGQLGNGTTTSSNVPVQVSGLTGIVAIAAGGNDSYALRSDGTVWAWGDNSAGQLGNASAGRISNSPVQVAISGVASIAAGGDFALAAKSDGSAWGWGDDGSGQLGDGGACGSSCKTPVQVSGLSATAAVSGGYVFSLGITSAGTEYGWGQNGEGQLGNGSTSSSKTPVATTNFGTVKRAPASASYSYNGDGQRATATAGGSTAHFAWDLTGSGFLLTDGSINYVYGPDGVPLEQVTASGSVFYFHQDQLGSTRLITDQSGATVGTYSYDPYGSFTAITGTVGTPFGYAGQYRDTESGLQYLRARYYDSLTAQFVTRDAAVSVTRRPYTYANDDPVNRIDPSGLYDYVHTEMIGAVSDVGTAANVMAFLQQNLAAEFPFSTGACTQVVLGESCILQPAPFNTFPSLVTVSEVGATSFTFTTGTPHIAGPGGTITFTTYVSGGNVYLQETGHAPNAPGWANIADPFFAQNFTWPQLANNLRQALLPQPCPPFIPILPLPFL